MKKDFDAWNEQKKILETNTPNVLFKEGEIWWCSIGLNVGSESCGKGETFQRPVLVLKKLSGTSYIGIPLSLRKKTGSWSLEIIVRDKLQSFLLYQIRMFSTNRFQRRFAALGAVDMAHIKQKLEALLELSHNHQVVVPGSVGCPKHTVDSNNSPC